MIVSGWLSVLSTDNNVQYVDYFAETARDDGSGADVFGTIALTLYQQGEGGSGLGDAIAYIRGYGTTSDGAVDVPSDPSNNGIFVNDSTFIQFRLAATFAYAYANAMTLPLDGNTARSRIVHRDFGIIAPDGRHLSRVRFGLRERNSRLDVQATMRRMTDTAADRHGLSRQQVTSREMVNDAPTKPIRMTLP